MFRLSSADSHIFPGQFSSDEPFLQYKAFRFYWKVKDSACFLERVCRKTATSFKVNCAPFPPRDNSIIEHHPPPAKRFSKEENLYYCIQSPEPWVYRFCFGIGDFYLVSACRISHIWQKKLLFLFGRKRVEGCFYKIKNLSYILIVYIFLVPKTYISIKKCFLRSSSKHS